MAYKTDVVEYSTNDDTASKYASLSLVPRHCFLLVAALAAIATARADALYGQNLLAALRAGGFVILMRHASSPLTAPDAAIADPDNVQHERQLDDSGRTAALAFGESLRRLHIPIGQVLSSPTYRALETVKLARLGQARLSRSSETPARACLRTKAECGQRGCGPRSPSRRDLAKIQSS